MSTFNPIQLVQLLEELLAVFRELKSDGTLDALVKAEQTVQSELTTNAKLKDLLSKLEALKA